MGKRFEPKWLLDLATKLGKEDGESIMNKVRGNMGFKKECWAILESFKNGKPKWFTCTGRSERNPYEIIGVTGYGEMYYGKDRCQRDVKELNDSWGDGMFSCVKVKMEVIE